MATTVHKVFALIKSLIKWLGYTLLTIIALLLIINSYDPAVKPEALAFAHLPGEPVPPEQNGYFDFVGYAAPLGEDPHQMGIKIVETYNQHVAAGGFFDLKNLDIPNTVIGPDKLEFHGKAKALCERQVLRCLLIYQQKEHEIQELVANNPESLKRYYHNYLYPHFRETETVAIAQYMATGDYETNSLVRAVIGVEAIHGKTQKALEALRQDTQYWRMVLGDSQTLITRMIATRRVSGNLQLLSEIIATRSMNDRAALIVQKILTPFNESEMDMSRVFHREFLLSMEVYEKELTQSTPDPSWSDYISWTVGSLFWKRHDSINSAYEKSHQLAMLAQLPSHELFRRWSSGDTTDWGDSSSFGWNCVYNPVGKVLNSVSLPDVFLPYVSRVRNLDALMRLVTLQWLAKEQHIPELQMPQFISKQGNALRNPYTGDPAQWDAQHHSLYFMGLREGDSGGILSQRIEVFVGTT